MLAKTFGKKDPKKLGPATVARYMAILSRAFFVATKGWQWLPALPMSKVNKPKVANSRIRYLSADDLERLRAAVAVSENKYLSTVLEVAVATGMRRAKS